MGNWHEHLEAMRRMLNLFAATGHINYAKSARLYLQTMQCLQFDHPWLYDHCERRPFLCTVIQLIFLSFGVHPSFWARITCFSLSL